MNVNILLGLLASIGVGLLVVGNIIDDVFDWVIIDTYCGVVLSLLAYRLISLRKTKTDN